MNTLLIYTIYGIICETTYYLVPTIYPDLEDVVDLRNVELQNKDTYQSLISKYCTNEYMISPSTVDRNTIGKVLIIYN